MISHGIPYHKGTRTPRLEKCAVCGNQLKRGEHRVCRACVVAFASLRVVKNPSGGLWKLSRRKIK